MSDIPPLVIALAGTRGTGKDSLCKALQAVDPNVARVAFADALKRDLSPFIAEHFGIDVFTATGADKELIRPLLIAYGMARRERDPLVWCRKTTDLIIEHFGPQAREPFPSVIPLVTDVRFVNEVNHLRATFSRDTHHAVAVIVNVTRDDSPPPTDEEEKHYREVAALADIHFHWGNDTWGQQCEKARKLRDDIFHLFDYA